MRRAPESGPGKASESLVVLLPNLLRIRHAERAESLSNFTPIRNSTLAGGL
jgi:hypothetical protein